MTQLTDSPAAAAVVPAPGRPPADPFLPSFEGAYLTGAEALVRSLETVGVDTVFGIPGGAILPAYDPLMDSTRLRHVLVRHEQGAGHAATGYAQATGRVGVCMATSGPGATNLVTPIADAYMDSVPIVAITGQVPSTMIGTDAFQEADICGITMPITKHNYLVTDPAEIPRV
ncbi:thiamine pyrophosphate-binding protein, partial [Kitasatospora sp. NPDC001540]|uniref:thiamine pyrophosphate-binding protein n=1 Tax=Kitasatospora sp. NPDC001540 TaxID=3364014 RepID=UPI00369D2314